MELVFLVSALVVSYAYVLYPVIVVAWSRLFHRRVEKRYRQIPVSVVIAAIANRWVRWLFHPMQPGQLAA